VARCTSDERKVGSVLGEGVGSGPSRVVGLPSTHEWGRGDGRVCIGGCPKSTQRSLGVHLVT